jgi:hypothetical protein
LNYADETGAPDGAHRRDQAPSTATVAVLITQVGPGSGAALAMVFGLLVEASLAGP